MIVIFSEHSSAPFPPSVLRGKESPTTTWTLRLRTNGIRQLNKAAMVGVDAFKILSYGVLGLGFLLALLAYRLLTKEQGREFVRSEILRAIYVFMVFSLLL